MKVTEGKVEVEVEKPIRPPDNLAELVEPAIQTSPKVGKIAGIVALVLAIMGILVIIYMQVAHKAGIWPYS